MLSVNAIYEDGRITLLEKIPRVRRARVIVTVLEEDEPIEQNINISLFDDMIGVASIRDNGSVAHDEYLNKESS